MSVSQHHTLRQKAARLGQVATKAFRSTGHLPLQRDAVTTSTRALLDEVHDSLLVRPQDASSAISELQFGLHEIKLHCSAEDWGHVVAACESHRVSDVVWQDPFTRHSYDRPGGYAGDARLLDYLYGVCGVPAGTTPVGAQIFGHWMTQRGAQGVRARGDVLAEMIDETAEQFARPRILSIACGHLREGTRSAALMDGRVGELVALDQDLDSLTEVERVYAGKPVRTMHCSVRAILSGKVDLSNFNFVYAAGLYDYLSERVAQRLTRLMFDMLAPDGRLLVANFAPGMPEVGYMEAFMAWTLIYRSPEEMARLSADIGSDEWKSHRVFWDASENIVFLEVVKRAAAKAAQRGHPSKRPAGLAVPGLNNVSFGGAVREPRATSSPE